jgi:hypothetical protein
MKKWHLLTAGLSFAGAFLCLTQAGAQGAASLGNWSTARNDAGHAGYQKAENAMSKDSIGQFKFLWKIKLGADAKEAQSYSEPLIVLRLINARGFKDLVVWAGTEDLYAVDSELGTMVWTKHYDVKPSPCGATNLASVMEPPPVINFGARRKPGTPLPPQQQPPMEASARRLGVAPGGGGFGLRGIYVLTADGYLHEQVLTTGADFAPPVKFLSGPGGVSTGLSMSGKVLYTATKAGCAGTQNAFWAINLASSDYPVSSYHTEATVPLVSMGPTIGDGGVAYAITGAGTTNAQAGVYANSIVALSSDAKVNDWYTPSGSGQLANVTPVAFTYKGKKLLAAPGKDGTFVLLDRESLGGSDHKTALAQTTTVFKPKSDYVSALASWQDSGGNQWVLASVPGPLGAEAKFANTNGAAPHGSIVAFKVDDADKKTSMTPVWISRDLINPAPPVIANGLVIALSQGDVKTPAKLFVLDAATGKELYSSGDAISTYAHLAGVSVGDGHAFFVTHDNTLYSFGIGIEH